jgi:hypothetical protein
MTGVRPEIEGRINYKKARRRHPPENVDAFDLLHRCIKSPGVVTKCSLTVGMMIWKQLQLPWRWKYERSQSSAPEMAPFISYPHKSPLIWGNAKITSGNSDKETDKKT